MNMFTFSTHRAKLIGGKSLAGRASRRSYVKLWQCFEHIAASAFYERASERDTGIAFEAAAAIVKRANCCYVYVLVHKQRPVSYLDTS